MKQKYYFVYEKMMDGSGELQAVFTSEADASKYAEEKRQSGRRAYYIKAVEGRLAFNDSVE